MHNLHTSIPPSPPTPPTTHQSINLMITIFIRPLFPSRRWRHLAESAWRPCELLTVYGLGASSSSLSIIPSLNLFIFYNWLLNAHLAVLLSSSLSVLPYLVIFLSVSLYPSLSPPSLSTPSLWDRCVYPQPGLAGIIKQALRRLSSYFKDKDA